jgi:chromosome segregation protein
MVYVKQIMLRNFKSFSGTSKLNLDPGFTVITGPNGSGKSNLLDAFQFVLGELGSRRMRVSAFSGLIYDEAGKDEEGKAKNDFAQVIIRLDNSDNGIAVDNKIVNIGRRVDREGRSRFFLNGKVVSRRTVIDVLKMAGISSEGYNIVLQGTATRLSDLTPAERMNAIESIIGISEYDEKKAEAKGRLEEAERKVEVASARIDEVRKRLVSLERERNDALRYRFLLEEERRLRIRRLSYEVLRVESEIEALNQKLKANEERLQGLEAQKQRLASERAGAKDELEGFSQETADKGNTRLPIIKSEIVKQREIIGALQRRKEEIERRKAGLLRSREEEESELERLEKERAEINGKIEALSKEASSAKEEIQKKESAILGNSEQIFTLKDDIVKNRKSAEEMEERLGPIRESLEGLGLEENKHSLIVESLGERIEELRKKKAEAEKGVESLRNSLKEFRELKKAEERKVEDFLKETNDRLEKQRLLRKRLEEARVLTSQVENTVTEFTAKRDLWKNIAVEERALQRIEEMSEAEAIAGYHGILRNLIKTEPKYRRAVEASSDGWINAVVVENLDSALQCIKSMKKSEFGIVRVLPLQEIRPLENTLQRFKSLEAEGEPKGEGIVAPLPTLIKCGEGFSPLISLIWGDTLLVKDDETALRVSGQGYRAVTISSDVYEPSGGVMGGHYRSIPEFSKLVPAEESITNLSKTIKALKSHLNDRMSNLRLSGDDMKKVSSYIDNSTKTIETIEGNLKQFTESLRRAERNAASMDKRMTDLQTELEGEKNLISSLRERKQIALQEISRIKDEIAQLMAKKPSDVADLEAQIVRLNQEIDALRRKGGELESESLSHRGRLESIVEPRISDVARRISSAGESAQNLEAESAKVKEELEAAEKVLKDLEDERNTLTEDVESTSRVLRVHQEKIRKIETEIEGAERRIASIEQERMGVTLEAERKQLRVDQLRRELAGLGQPEPLPTQEDELREIEGALKVVHAEAESLGAINQLAVMQYDDQMGNYKQLSIRINELESEKASILKFIAEIEDAKLKHFMKSFNEICENFTEFFSKLTGGGEGRLEFQNPEDPFSAGIDLFLQFPGKPMRLASGHSGGERSVGAIAYLLAIQRFLKAPFYIFDEIDAHLDDFNVERLAEVLKENSSKAQFIVISLKDSMISTAEQVHGCFSRVGKSRIISLPKLEVAH